MSRPPSHDAHRRTRDDHATETAEDYVEAIAELIEAVGVCRVVDLARHFGVSHVTVTKTIRRLETDAGLVATEPRQPIRLTAKGRRLAKLSRERHAIVRDFLLAIGLPARIAEVDAEGIEHHVSPETLARFREIAERKSL